MTTHRLAYEEAFGPIPPGLWVLHKCDTPACINPDHLFVGTNADNVRDREKKGRWKPRIGEKHHLATLTEAKVRKIIEMLAGGARVVDAARQNGASIEAVAAIKSHRTWRHIPRPASLERTKK